LVSAIVARTARHGIGRNRRTTARTTQPTARSSDATGAPRADDRGVKSRRHELRDLEHTAEVGESDKTPLILIADMWVVSAIAVAVILALSFLAYYLAA
jgi:hypothetical protein